MTGKAVEPHDTAILSREGVIRTLTSLALPPDFTYEEYEDLMCVLGLMHRASAFYIGDALNDGERLFPDNKYLQAAELTGLSPGTLINYASICNRVPPSRRNDHLSFSHHAEVAALEPAAQKEWLEVAVEERLTKNDLRARIKDEIPPEIRVAEICECCKRPL